MFGRSFCRRIVMMVGIMHLCLTGVGYTSNDHDKAGPHGQPMDAATQAMMATWQAYASPNDNHKMSGPVGRDVESRRQMVDDTGQST